MTLAGWLVGTAAMDALAFFKTVLRSTLLLQYQPLRCRVLPSLADWDDDDTVSVIKRCGNYDGKQLFADWGLLVLYSRFHVAATTEWLGGNKICQ